MCKIRRSDFAIYSFSQFTQSRTTLIRHILTHAYVCRRHTNVCQNQLRVSAPPLNLYQCRGSSREFGPHLFEVQIKAYALLLALITATHSTVPVPRPATPPRPSRAHCLPATATGKVKMRCSVIATLISFDSEAPTFDVCRFAALTLRWLHSLGSVEYNRLF